MQRLYALGGSGHRCTAQKVHRTLSQALSLAVRWDWLPANPCDRLEAHHYRSAPRQLWSVAQLRAFLESAADHPLWPFWVLAVHTGCRRSELTVLTWKGVDLPGESLTIRHTVRRIGGARVFSEPKARSGCRRVGFAAQAVAALRAQQRIAAERRTQSGEG